MKTIPFFFLLCGAGLISAIFSGCTDKMAMKEITGPKITREELYRYCPSVDFLDGASFYDIYKKGSEGNRNKIVYQAVISDLTRSCSYSEDALEIKVAAAGRVVPGAAFKTSAIIMPIDIRIMKGNRILFSKIYKYTVSDVQAGKTRQFIFSNDSISIPQSEAHDTRVSVGFAITEKKGVQP